MSDRTTVLKFGGSVLNSEQDLPKAVHEIYRHWRRGSQVLAVVSAFGGKTDELVRQSKKFSPEPDSESAASLLLTGEATTAALLSLELRRVGLPTKILSAHQIDLRTRGDRHDAKPVWADADRIREELRNSIVIVSGFGGIDSKGGPTLLGRGGSDFTALFLAERLGARCVLIKDVDGLYDRDPALNGQNARRFKTASYATAIDLGGQLIQEKSVRFAEHHELSIEIASLGSGTGTTIEGSQDRFAVHTEFVASPLRVALLGCGTVGGGVYERLAFLGEKFDVIGVANLDPAKARAANIPTHLITTADELAEREYDVLVETIGGLDPAQSHITKALAKSRHVVTANKAVVAAFGNKFERISGLSGAQFKYSAAVGGALPALETVSQRNGHGYPVSIAGIVNGTCNFICDRVAAGLRFDEAVALAQAAGFAEADPTTDIDGTDAAHKLVLLARAAFDATISFDSIRREGIGQLDRDAVLRAAKNGRVIRLVAECTLGKNGVNASVAPRELPLEHPFAGVSGADNCLLVRTDSGFERVIRARGAGRYATAESVIADLFDIHRSHTATPISQEFRARTAEAGK